MIVDIPIKTKETESIFTSEIHYWLVSWLDFYDI